MPDPITIYGDRESFQKTIKQLELDHDEALQAPQNVIYEAMIVTAVEHEKDWVENIHHIRRKRGDYE